MGFWIVLNSCMFFAQDVTKEGNIERSPNEGGLLLKVIHSRCIFRYIFCAHATFTANILANMVLSRYLRTELFICLASLQASDKYSLSTSFITHAYL